MTGRTATEERKTSETRIRVVLGVDGIGQHRVKTPIGFLTHMVEQLARHGSFDLEVDAEPGVNHASCAVEGEDGRLDLRLEIVEWHVGLSRWSRTMIAARAAVGAHPA